MNKNYFYSSSSTQSWHIKHTQSRNLAPATVMNKVYAERTEWNLEVRKHLYLLKSKNVYERIKYYVLHNIEFK